MVSRTLRVIAGALATLVVLSSAADAAQWTCSAPGLRNFNYSGGDTAYIHLNGYNRGGHYKVTRTGNTAKGETADGTTFTCKAS